MKKLISRPDFQFFCKLMLVSFAMFLCLCFSASAQTVKQDASGNYIAVKKVADTSAATSTGHTFTDAKGNVYNVFQSTNGKLYVNRISKAGNAYKQYLKVN